MTALLHNPSPVGLHHQWQRGLSLVELLVALALGLFLVAGILTIFVNSSRTTAELAKTNRQIENGRFALHVLREDLMHGGYWGEFSPGIPATPALPDPCAGFPFAADATDNQAAIRNFLAIPVQGYDDGTGLPVSCNTVVTNRLAGTDVLVIRHADTCNAGAGNCEAINNQRLYFQVSLCSADLDGSAATNPLRFVSGNALGVMSNLPTDFILRQRDASGRSCTHAAYAPTIAERRRVLSHIYYVRSFSVTAGDGIPTLMRSELDLESGNVIVRSAQPLIDGIEDLQVEYGVDTSGDGAPNVFTPAPATVADWTNVVAVKVHVLARNLESTGGYTDTKVYQLGLDSAGNPYTVGPFSDSFKRHAYSTYIRLVNPSSRREVPP